MSGPALNCAEVRDRLQPFLDGELSVEQNVALLKHSELCSACAGFLEREQALVSLVKSAASEPVPSDKRRALLDGAFREVERERTRGRWRVVAALAALILATVGLVSWHSDPLCLSGCGTAKIARAALAAARETPQTIDDLQRTFPRPLRVPRPCGLEVEGGYMVRMFDVVDRPLIRLRCKRSGQRVLLVHVPGGHMHFWQRKTCADGRCYFRTERPDLCVVGWEEGDGMWLVVTEREVRQNSLFVAAAALRDAFG